jgi:hypothetical protein
MESLVLPGYLQFLFDLSQVQVELRSNDIFHNYFGMLTGVLDLIEVITRNISGDVFTIKA